MNRVPTTCQPCADNGRQGTCARHRCYCGHPQCWAYDSWQPIRNNHQAPATTGAFPYPEETP